MTTTALRQEIFGHGALPGPRPLPRSRPGRPLSIVHLITRLDRGGSSDCTLLQAIGAARRGHRVLVLSGPTAAPTSLLDTARRQARLRLIEIPGLCRAIAPIRDLRALLAIVRLFREERPDLIHTHTSKAGALGRIAAWTSGFGRSVLHQPHGHLFYGYYGRAGSAIVTLTERLLAPLAQRQIALSWRGAEEHLSRGIGRPEDWRVVRSGIDLRPFRRAGTGRVAARRRLGIRDGELLVGSLCRLEPIKGVEDLVLGFMQAAGARSHLRLLLAGDGPLRETLSTLVRSRGLADRVLISDSWVDPLEILPALDLFVLASRNEGMGRALVEAMASGLPVIACAVGGVPEVLEEGRDGLLIPPGDPEGIALAIGRLADDERLRSQIARRARGRAVAFGAGKMVRTLLRLYSEVSL